MTKTSFLSGLGLGVVAGSLVAMKLHKDQPYMKRNMQKAKRKAESFMDDMGM